MDLEILDPVNTRANPSSFPLLGKTAFVTGASRGIGASVAKQLAAAGADVAINYRSKESRARTVGEEVRAFGRRALVLQGDITNATDISSNLSEIRSAWERLDVLVLNASGGLEKGRESDYAMQLNSTAQVNLTLATIPLMPPGGRIVFVTSHLAHFCGARPVPEAYRPVAISKRAGEDALRKLIPSLSQAGIRLAIVSGDLIEGTITPRLLQKRHPGLIDSRRQDAGFLPTIDEFAAAIVRAAADDSLSTGNTFYVGSTR